MRSPVNAGLIILLRGGMMGKAGVIIAAAGSGTRMGHEVNKVLLPLGGVPVLIRSIKAFADKPWVRELVVVVRREDSDQIAALVEKWQLGSVKIVVGGKRRQDSVAAGINALSREIDWVFIHDGARPLINGQTIDTAYEMVKQYRAVGVAVPVKDTIKVVDSEQMIIETPPREQLWAMQTPQVFSRELIEEAYREAEQQNWEATDDCSLVERLGVLVKLVPGTYANLKITTPEDLTAAAQYLEDGEGGSRMMRTGIGYDVHRLTADCPLILAGVKVDYHLGLAGHSDADVATHALMDALLGAAGLGDIGRHFPDTDPSYKDASSLELLKVVMQKLNKLGYQVNNVDLVIMAERPKLAPYMEQMHTILAEVINIDREQINIKATTTEQLGFVGRGEGIAALATASVYKLY